MLAATASATHGLASALLVVARMIGMLVGVSALTAIGLHRFYAVSSGQPALSEICPDDTLCDAYVDLVKHAGIEQMHAIFWGAAVAAGIAALLAVALLPRSRESQ
jgi:hypothetical protein